MITVFSASNHRGRHNRAGAVLLAPSAEGLDVACRDLGICPSWRVLSKQRGRQGGKRGAGAGAAAAGHGAAGGVAPAALGGLCARLGEVRKA